MRAYYDFHIHSALSPCANNDMTPNNIVNMARIKGLDAIAITDHNSTKNIRATMECGEKNGLLVVPGMEIETQEEVHILTLFSTIEGAEEVGSIVYESLPDIEINENIFGEQIVYNAKDEEVCREKKLLVTATGLTISEVFALVRKCGGIPIPAHVDRHSYSIISNLGFIPDDLDITSIEISNSVDQKAYLANKSELSKYRVMHNSDAHYLWDISERKNYINTIDKNLTNLIKFFSTILTFF